MTLMLVTGIPVRLPLLFEEGYDYFYNSEDAARARLAISKGKGKPHKYVRHNNMDHDSGKRYNDYRNYLDQFKALNPKYSAITTHLMKGVGQRIKRYYDKYQSITEAVMRSWTSLNMPYVLLSKDKIKTDRPVIKLHLAEVTREKIDYELSQGRVVRLDELPKDFSLTGYEVYGNGSIDDDSVLGHVSLLDKVNKTDILSNIFVKGDKSEYANAEGKLDWLADLEGLVQGSVIDTIHVRKSRPVVNSISLWYNVKVAIPYNDKGGEKTYKGLLITKDPITKLPFKLDNSQDFNFLHNFITSDNSMIELPETIKKEGFSVRILTATLASAAINGLVGFGVTTITLEPKRLYYLVGRKGSGKSTKIKLLEQVANVEDSDDYGVFLTIFLRDQGMLDVSFDQFIEWRPDGGVFAKAVNNFVVEDHDYDNETSIFLLYARAFCAIPMTPAERRQKLITRINWVMNHPFVGVRRYADIRKQLYDPAKPTFVMCHSTAETGFRETPDDTIVLSEVINSAKIVGKRDRSGTGTFDEAEMLLYYAYAEGISTIGKILPFALILEQLRRVLNDNSYGALQMVEEGVKPETEVQQ